MNQAPLLFLGAFAAMALSWFGFIVQPQLQLGRATPGTNAVNKVDPYPQARSGLAQQGLQVYRSLGCVACHSQQVRQTGAVFDLVLTSTGTNTADLVEAIHRLNGISTPEAGRLISTLPAVIRGAMPDKVAADAAAKALDIGGAKVEVRMLALGADVERGWGHGRTVAADFLYDQPPLPGGLRLGPDLANAGLRLNSAEWHYRHLYQPNAVRSPSDRKSVMPPYRFLFERRVADRPPTPDAFTLAASPVENVIAGSRTNWMASPGGETGAVTGTEWIVPTDDARALVAYLLSLKTEVPLLERPVAAAPAGATNLVLPVAAGSTNAAALSAGARNP